MIKKKLQNRSFKNVSILLFILLIGCSKKDAGVTAAYTDTPGPDPLAPYLWHLNESENRYVNGANTEAGSSINLGLTHDFYTGKGVVVIVSDSSVELTHPELTTNANRSLSKDYRKSSPFLGTPSSSDKSDGHGTAVAGLVLGKKNNSHGGFGVAPDATLIGTNFVSSNQSLSRAIDQATFNEDQAIFNYSYGYNNCQINEGDGENYLEVIRNGVFGKNHIYVTASGNDFIDSLANCDGNSSTYYFGNANFDQLKTYPYFLVIAANSARALSADYSTPGSNVWISAPGGDSDIGMMVADLVGCSLGFSNYAQDAFNRFSSETNPNCSYYSEAMGTSFATPLVSGAIGILREVNPDLSWRDIKHILATTATQIHSNAISTNHPVNSENLNNHEYQQGWVVNKALYPFHPWYGFGQLNLEEAIELAKNPDFDLYELRVTDNFSNEPSYTSGDVDKNIPDHSALGVSDAINVDKHDLFIEHVQVIVNITHPAPKDLGIELTSPEGTTNKLMNINSRMVGTNLSEVRFGVNGLYGEKSKGQWTIKIVDGKAGNLGVLNNWSLSIMGNKGDDQDETINPLPVSDVSLTGSNLTWTASSSGDVIRTEICISPSTLISSACNDGDWRFVTGTTLALSSYVYQGIVGSYVSGREYTAKIKAIDTSENESTIESFSWVMP